MDREATQLGYLCGAIGCFWKASGSLKRVAREYGVSYPTVRARLDRLIAKIEVVDQQRIEDEFERLLRIKLAEGKLDAGTMRALLEAHRRGGRS